MLAPMLACGHINAGVRATCVRRKLLQTHLHPTPATDALADTFAPYVPKKTTIAPTSMHTYVDTAIVARNAARIFRYRCSRITKHEGKCGGGPLEEHVVGHIAEVDSGT